MSEEEYEDRIDSSTTSGGFSPSQEEKALNIRTPASEEDLEELEREQESNVIEVRGEGEGEAQGQRQQRESRQPVRVYDSRDMTERPRYITSTASGDSAVILPNEQKQTAQTRQAEIERQSIGSIQQAQEIQKRSIFNRIKNFILRRK